MNHRRRLLPPLRRLATLLTVVAALGACDSTKGSDSQTNWICESDADCAAHGTDLVCIAGACIAPSGNDGGNGTGGTDGGADISSATAPLQLSLGIAENISVFQTSAINFLPPRCASRAFSNCAVVDCRVDRIDGGLFGLTGVSAGAITVNGGAGGNFTLTPDPFGVYAPSSSTFQTGDVFQIAATGDTVPAFTATVTLLPPLTLTTPDPTIPRQVTSVSRAAGLPLAWQSTDQTVTAGVIMTGTAGGTWDQIEGYCDFPASAGSATLPSELFRDFPAGPAALYAGHSQVKTFQSGTHPIRVLTNHGDASLQLTLL